MPAPAGKKRPRKPPGCPLFAHRNGQWAKKIQGRLRYFGRWEDLNAALAEYYRQKPFLDAGHEAPPPGSDLGLTVKDLANRWLTYQQERVAAEELRPRTWSEYHMAARFAVEILGPHVPVQTLKAADFQPLRNHLFEKYGFDGRAKFVKIIRSMFKWGFENELLEKPVRFGTYFSLPSQRAKRLERAIRRRQRGDRMFTAAQIRHQLEAATDALRAMILLGINGGLGNEDCAQLLIDMIDAKKKTIDYARGKTGIGRVVPLWPETLAALNDVIGNRAEGRVFLTRWGNPFIEERVKKEDGRIVGFVRKDGIADAYGKLLRRLKQYRPGMNFYALRHTLRTIGAELRDTEAIRWIMGHQRSDADGEYIECLPVLRLRKVTDYVHDWLFPPKSGK